MGVGVEELDLLLGLDAPKGSVPALLLGCPPISPCSSHPGCKDFSIPWVSGLFSPQDLCTYCFLCLVLAQMTFNPVEAQQWFLGETFTNTPT